MWCAGAHRTLATSALPKVPRLRALPTLCALCALPAGVVILMMDTRLEPPVAKDMIKGAPDFLCSEFHLTYSMLLNLLRCV